MFNRKLVFIFLVLFVSYVYVGINKDRYIAEEIAKRNEVQELKKNNLDINYSLVDSDGYFFDITQIQQYKIIFSSSVDRCNNQCIHVMKEIYYNVQNKKISFIFFTNDTKKDHLEKLAEFKKSNEIHFNIVTGNYKNIIDLLKIFNKTLHASSSCSIFEDNIDMIYVLNDKNICIKSAYIFDDKFFIEDFIKLY